MYPLGEGEGTHTIFLFFSYSFLLGDIQHSDRYALL